MKLKKSISVLLAVLLIFSVFSTPTVVAAEAYSTVESAGAYVREQLKAQEQVISLTYLCSAGEVTGTFFNELIDLIEDEAFAHTGVPDEGDYLGSHYESISASVSAEIAGDICSVGLEYEMEYRTTPQREADTTQKLLAIREELGLDGMDPYERPSRSTTIS